MIRPLHIKAAYQRPCSSRLSSDKHHFVRDIMELIGVDLVDRKYQDENALCCGDIFGMMFGYDLRNDVQKRNLDDMIEHGAEYCFLIVLHARMHCPKRLLRLALNRFT